jgi:hypothetical protein
MTPVKVYLEIGKTRAFAIAPDWPGWCRSGRDEALALQSLYDYGSRYTLVLQHTRLAFYTPPQVSDLVVVDRLAGNATTDFGAPDRPLPDDTQPITLADMERFQIMLEACWGAFDAAVEAAVGRTLRKGPRGGGRDLAQIIEHVWQVERGYLGSLGGKIKPVNDDEPVHGLMEMRRAILTTLLAAVRGEIPAQGPRGGLRWTPRYFVRRLAWHELDHAWEIEDRVE